MITIRRMMSGQRDEVAALVRVSTNAWYEAHGREAIFTGDVTATRVFCDVYEAMDPGCCLVAVEDDSGKILGSCFYHPRRVHVSLGIMNVHPDAAGRGIARQLLERIITEADRQGLPVRLVSSAINLDSFSLYTRAGFVPRMSFQDMFVKDAARVPELPGTREATAEDVEAMAALEAELVGIERADDYRFFIDNAQGIWRTLVHTDQRGAIDGFLASVHHPGSHMLGPGVMRSDEAAAALIANHLRFYSDSTPVFLVPCDRADLVATLYGWGARNCELHFAQVRGAWREPTGIIIPTFMPETG